MKPIIEWLSFYGAEYDVRTKILYIRKPMQVGDFVELKKILKKMNKINDIVLEREVKVWKIK